MQKWPKVGFVVEIRLVAKRNRLFATLLIVCLLLPIRRQRQRCYCPHHAALDAHKYTAVLLGCLVEHKELSACVT